MAEFRIDKFNGGITDNFLTAEPNMAQRCDNLLVDRNGKLFLRSGSVIEDASNPLTPKANTRISKLVGFKRRSGEFNYFKIQGHQVFALTSLGHIEVQGVNGRPFFSAGTNLANISYDEWNDHIIATVADSSGIYAYPTLGFFPTGDDLPVGINCGFKRPTNFSATSTGSSLYTYAVHYEYDYSVGDVQFVMRGAVELVQTTADTMDGSSIITAIWLRA